MVAGACRRNISRFKGVQAGASLVSSNFTFYHLSEQHRSECKIHDKLLAAVSNTLVDRPYTRIVCDSLTELTEVDFQTGGFIDAIVTTSTNSVAASLSIDLIRSFAHRKGLPIYTFECPLRLPEAEHGRTRSCYYHDVLNEESSSPTEVWTKLYPHLLQRFVVGMPLIIESNLNQKKRIVNGTLAKFHSFAFYDTWSVPEGGPGEEVRVPFPFAINTTVGDTIVSVGPTQQSTMRKKKIHKRYYSHKVSQAFTSTFHKLQGEELVVEIDVVMARFVFLSDIAALTFVLPSIRCDNTEAHRLTGQAKREQIFASNDRRSYWSIE